MEVCACETDTHPNASLVSPSASQGYHPTHAQHCRRAGRSSLALLVRDKRQIMI